jgi:hypothetical protein
MTSRYAANADHSNHGTTYGRGLPRVEPSDYPMVNISRLEAVPHAAFSGLVESRRFTCK